MDGGEIFGYNLAEMRYDILLAPGAVEALRRLRAFDRARVTGALETYLRVDPRRTGKSRIKRLRGMNQPQYRLRVGKIRVFYDVQEETVAVLAIVSKEQAREWLGRQGTPEP